MEGVDPAKGNQTTAPIYSSSLSVGFSAQVNATQGLAVGDQATVASGATGGTALGYLTTAGATNATAIGSQAAANGQNSVAIGSGAQAAASNSVAIGSQSVANLPNTFSVGSAGNERQITNVAAGQVSATSTDAVNGSQLYSQVAAIDASLSTIQNSQANGMFQVGPDANTAAPPTTVPAASGTNSVAGGSGAVASGASSTALGNGAQATANNSVAIGAGSVANTANSVSVGSAGNTRQITNVSAGTAATDGVNVGQLNSGITQAQNWSKSYTDQQFRTVNQNMNNIGNRANAGIASTIAMTNLAQPYQANMSGVGVALGSFHGETGIAVGLSTVSENGHWVFKANASTDSRGDAGAGVGATMMW